MYSPRTLASLAGVKLKRVPGAMTVLPPPARSRLLRDSLREEQPWSAFFGRGLYHTHRGLASAWSRVAPADREMLGFEFNTWIECIRENAAVDSMSLCFHVEGATNHVDFDAAAPHSPQTWATPGSSARPR